MKFWIALCFIILFSTKLWAGGIKGKITSANYPLVGVNVFIKQLDIGTVSNSEGNYFFSNLEENNYEVKFSIIGYKTVVKNVNVQSNKIAVLNIEMTERVIKISEIEVIDKKIQPQSDTKVSVINLQPEKARLTPGAVTDVFRTLQSVPGVLAPSDFSSQLIIRGSGPDQNLIVMDDVEIFNPYRLYGVISMFNPEAVSNLQLITGGFPARYGDRLSAVLDVTNRQGNTSKGIEGNLNASIVSANLVLEGKNPLNIPGSWLINSRRTYYDLIIEPFVKGQGLVDENVSFPNFFDIQSKLVFGPFKNHLFTFNNIISRDGVDLISAENRSTPDSIGILNLSKNDLASFAWNYTPSKKIFNKLIFSWYRNSGNTDFDTQILDPSLNRELFNETNADTLNPYLLGFGFDSQFLFSKYSLDDKFNYFYDNHEFEAGVGIDWIRTDFLFDFDVDPELLSFFSANSNISATLDDLNDTRKFKRIKAYISNKFKVNDKLFFNAGARLDHYEFLEKTYISPRISASFAIDNLTTLRAVWGIYYQSPGYEKLRDRQLFLNFSPSIAKSLKAEKATHYVLSLEKWMSPEWRIKVESYYKKFDDLIVQKIISGKGYFVENIAGLNPKLKSSWTRPVPFSKDSLTNIPVNNSIGESYGVEFLVEKKNIVGENIINGWISYAYSVAERNENNRIIPFTFDQRHTANLVLDYKYNDWLSFGLRFQFGSGFPITEAIGIKPRIILEDNDGDLIPETPVLATRKENNGERTNQVLFDVDFGDLDNKFKKRKPNYHRLDLRINALTNFWDLDWTFYLDIINVYNRANVINYDYFLTEDLELKRVSTNMFPIIPTFGFRVKF